MLDSNKTEYTFEEFAAAVRTDIDERDKQEENLRLRKNLRAIRYWEGRQLGYISPHTGQWKDAVVQYGDPWYPNNQIRFFTRSILKEMVRSRSQLSVQPRDDRMESAGAARLIRGLIDRYRQEQFGPLASQTEAMFAMLEGNYFRYLWWDFSVDRYKHEITEYEKQKLTIGKDAFHCPHCGAGGYVPEESSLAPSFEQPLEQGMTGKGITSTEAATEIIPPGSISCPNCGALADYLPSVEKEVELPVGKKEVPTGDLRNEIVDPMEMKVHLRARTIPQSPFLERIRMILVREGKRLFPHWNGQTFAGGDPDKFGLRIMQELEGSPGNYKSHTPKGAHSRGSSNDLVPFTQIWLDSVYYYDITLKEDFFLGPKDNPYFFLAKGTKLIEEFPLGMYIGYLADSVVDARNENKNKFWTHGNYIAAPHRFWGDGAADDALDQQWELNNLDSLLIEHIMFNVGGQTWYNQLKIEGSTLGARPRERNPMRNPSPGDNPGDFIYDRPPVPISSEVPLKGEQIKRDMQSQFGAFSVSSGMPDVNVSTATGMAILRDQALGFLGPPLELRGEVDVEWSYQALELIQENLVGKRYITFGKYDDIEGQWFEAADVRTDFIITQIPGSWFPVSDFDMRQRAMELATFGGVAMGIWNPMWPDQVRTFVLEKYGLPLNLNEREPDERKQRIELETMREAFAEFESQGGMLVDEANQPDPLAVSFVASVAPVEMFVDNDDVQFQWIERYLKTDEGMKEHPVMRAALLMHQRAHVDNKYRKEMMLMMMQGIAQGALMAMPDGSVVPTAVLTGGDPNKPNQPNSSGPGSNNDKVKQRGANVGGSPSVVGSDGSKNVGDSLPMAQAGSTTPGSQPGAMG